MDNFGWKVLGFIGSIIGVFASPKISSIISGAELSDFESMEIYLSILLFFVVIAIFMSLLLAVDYNSYIKNK